MGFQKNVRVFTPDRHQRRNKGRTECEGCEGKRLREERGETGKEEDKRKVMKEASIIAQGRWAPHDIATCTAKLSYNFK